MNKMHLLIGGFDIFTAPKPSAWVCLIMLFLYQNVRLQGHHEKPLNLSHKRT